MALRYDLLLLMADLLLVEFLAELNALISFSLLSD
jgi:hypothetical protein